MQQDHTATFDLPDPEGVCLAYGWGVKIHVRHGHLIVCDGVGRSRRQRRYARVTAPFDRLIVLGHSGYVTFEAIDWLQGIGASLIQVDSDGKLIGVTGALGHNLAKLRRAQAQALDSPMGLGIARQLLEGKLAGQADVGRRLPTPVHIDPADVRRAGISTTRDMLSMEAQVAHDYWQAWEPVPVTFARKDVGRIPDHWYTFGQRRSPITRSGKAAAAATPANAILNYLYAILEAEARIACLAVGLDPALGVLHADHRARDSLALDIIEPVRPKVEAWVLDLLDRHPFRARDFIETRRGVCRILPPLSVHLAGTAPVWAAHLAPIAEHVAQQLVSDGSKLPTPLTRRNTHARFGKQPPKPPKPKLPAGCRACGILLGTRRATLREDCDADRECAVCGRSLAGKMASAKICSPRCRNKAVAASQRQQRRQAQPDGCLICGQSLADRQANARYCSKACKAKAYHRRKKIGLTVAH